MVPVLPARVRSSACSPGPLWIAALFTAASCWIAGAEEAADGACPANGCDGQGLKLPRVIIGCWQLLERNPDQDAAVKTLLAYAHAGFTAFDTADIYGPSETILGELKRRWEGPALWFFTKYVTDNPSAAEAKRINDRSRRSLGVEALELVQFHWWSLARDGSAQEFLKAGRELSQLKKQGRIRHLAGCNMDTTNLRLLVEDGMAVEANQVQYSLLDRRPEVRLLPYCKEQGIQLAVFGVVGGGLLSDAFLGVSLEKARGRLDSVSRRMYWSSLQRWAGDWGLFQQLLQTLQAVGLRHMPALPVAAVACAWALQRLQDLGAGGGLILGVRDTGHLKEHTALLRGEVQVTEQDMAEIQAVLDQGLPPTGDVWYEERGWA